MVLLTIELKFLCASRASSQVARGIIEIAMDQPVYVVLTNLSEKKVVISKLMIIAHMVSR